MPTSPRLEKEWIRKPPERSGDGISPSGSRLSRTGARADIFRTCGSRVLAGDYRYTFVSADHILLLGGGSSSVAFKRRRKMPERLARACGVWKSAGWLTGWLVGWKLEVPQCPNSPSPSQVPKPISSDRQRSHSPQPPYLKLVMSQKRKRSVAIAIKKSLIVWFKNYW